VHLLGVAGLGAVKCEDAVEEGDCFSASRTMHTIQLDFIMPTRQVHSVACACSPLQPVKKPTHFQTRKQFLSFPSIDDMASCVLALEYAIALAMVQQSM
jgi:hypothetical protein